MLLLRPSSAPPATLLGPSVGQLHLILARDDIERELREATTPSKGGGEALLELDTPRLEQAISPASPLHPRCISTASPLHRHRIPAASPPCLVQAIAASELVGVKAMLLEPAREKRRLSHRLSALLDGPRPPQGLRDSSPTCETSRKLRDATRAQRRAALSAEAKAALLVETAVCPVWRQRPVRPPGGSEGSGRFSAPQSAADQLGGWPWPQQPASGRAKLPASGRPKRLATPTT